MVLPFFRHCQDGEHRLFSYTGFGSMKIIGLMSGTSADGVDAALVEIKKRESRISVKLVAFTSAAFSQKLQTHILKVCESGTGGEVCDLNVLLGEKFSKAALKLIDLSGLSPNNIHLIGSHGQTLYHHPHPPTPSTLQIGEPSVIAERTGITTIADFRPRDMAAGGEGAPLTPYTHQVLFQHKTKSRLIVNLGGICNVTYVPAKTTQQKIEAFDVGPANMMINSAIRFITNGKKSQDTNGFIATKGSVYEPLLKKLLEHQFLKRRPPKSTGRHEFGDSYVERLLHNARRYGLKNEDFIATLTAFSAKAAAKNQTFLPGPIQELILVGGGTKNKALVKEFFNAFAPTPVRTSEAYGWDSRAVEATAFAVMAYCTIHGIPNNLPSITGAETSVVMGKIIPGRSFYSASR